MYHILKYSLFIEVKIYFIVILLASQIVEYIKEVTLFLRGNCFEPETLCLSQANNTPMYLIDQSFR